MTSRKKRRKIRGKDGKYQENFLDTTKIPFTLTFLFKNAGNKKSLENNFHLESSKQKSPFNVYMAEEEDEEEVERRKFSVH